MVQRRGPAFLVVPLLLLTLFLAGCPKRPATTGAVAPAPTAPAAAPAAPAPAPAAMQPATPAAPAPAAAPRPSEFALNANLKTIYFDFDKYELRQDTIATLKNNASWIKSHSKFKVLVEGHCDERGTIEYNLELGAKRAHAVQEYLINLGVERSRLRTISYGEERPVNPGHDEGAWAKNRRAEFTLEK